MPRFVQNIGHTNDNLILRILRLRVFVNILVQSFRKWHMRLGSDNYDMKDIIRSPNVNIY